MNAVLAHRGLTGICSLQRTQKGWTVDETAVEREVLSRVPLDRRQFVKRAIGVGAFAVPVVSSFSLESFLTAKPAAAAGNSG
jgi:hypothetical protein